MNWLLALLAFAGLMTILSTVVYVAVEALHKGLSLRKSGLAEMLRALHDNVIVGLEQDRAVIVPTQAPKGNSAQAVDFAVQMQGSPTYAGKGRWWWPSNWKIGLNQRKFERLTRRQLAEQLARTEYGQTLARQDRSRIEFALTRIGYEFDRFGEAQSVYFRQRAKVMSGFVAFLFVMFANINVIDVYFYLARNEQALTSTLSKLRADQPEQFAKIASGIEDNARALTGLIDGDLDGDGVADIEPDGQGLTSEAALASARDLQIYLTELQGGLDLPIGRAYFPYCEGPLADYKTCGGAEIDGKLSFFGVASVPATPAMERLLSDWGVGITWLLSMIASAGLLALGAPFWYDTFSKVAMIAGNAAAARVAGANTSKKEVVVEKPKNRFDRTDNPDIEDLADAFVIAAGVPPAEMTPGALTTGTPNPLSQTLPAPHATTSAGKTIDLSAGPVLPEPVYEPQNPSLARSPNVAFEKAATTETQSTVQPKTSDDTRPIRGVRGNWKGE